MKRIEAYIQPHHLDKVVAALHVLPRFPGFTVLSGHGQGHGRGTGGQFAYGESDGLLHHAHCVMTVLCEDADADGVVQAIALAAHTGHSGDGIIAVSEVIRVLAIRDTAGEA